MEIIRRHIYAALIVAPRPAHQRRPTTKTPSTHTQTHAHRYSNTYNHISHVVLYFRFMLLNTPLSHLRQSHQKPPIQKHTYTGRKTRHAHPNAIETHSRPQTHTPTNADTFHPQYPHIISSWIYFEYMLNIYIFYTHRICVSRRDKLAPALAVKKISRKARARFVLALNHTNTHIYFV